MAEVVQEQPLPDFNNVEEVHQRVGQMLHNMARLLPPAPDALDSSNAASNAGRPIPRHNQPLPAFSGVPRHRDQWLQDMMMSFSSDPAVLSAMNSKSGSKEAGGVSLEEEQQQKQKQHQDNKTAPTPAENPYTHLFPTLDKVEQVSRRARQQSAFTSSNTATASSSTRPPQSFVSPHYAEQQRLNRASSAAAGKKHHQQKKSGAAASSSAPAAESSSTSPETKPRVIPGAVVAPKGKKANVITAGSSSKPGAAAAAASEKPKPTQQKQQPRPEDVIDNTPCDPYDVNRELREDETLFCYVEFKRNRLRKIPCELPGGVECGTYVIVHGDRDWDMGLVIAKTIERRPLSAVKKGTASSGNAKGGKKKNHQQQQQNADDEERRGLSSIRAEGFYQPGPPGRRVAMQFMADVDMNDAELDSVRAEAQPVIRLAMIEESNLLQNEFPIYEEEARQMCQYYCNNEGLGIDIIDCELQFDRKKISFFFDADRAVDFRNLVKDLFKVFGARIWMENVNDRMYAGEIAVPPQKRREPKKEQQQQQRSASRGRSRSPLPKKEGGGGGGGSGKKKAKKGASAGAAAAVTTASVPKEE